MLGSGDLAVGQSVEGWVTSIVPRTSSIADAGLLDALVGFIMSHESPRSSCHGTLPSRPFPIRRRDRRHAGLEPTPTPGI